MRAFVDDVLLDALQPVEDDRPRAALDVVDGRVAQRKQRAERHGGLVDEGGEVGHAAEVVG